ncbi:MAG: glycosyltransferase family 2 protein [Bacteroidetes bacterium]|nr:glycosyltransferase family 2 protein [Bacteroidota bacterium]
MITIIEILSYYNYLVLFYLLIIVTIYIFLNLVSFTNISKHSKKRKYVELKDIFRIHNFKPITIIVPAFNEEDRIVECVQSLLQLEYPDYQIIVVNDSSTDGTLEQLFENFQIRQASFSPYYEIESQEIKAVYLSPAHPNLVVIDKGKGGKADSINAAINISRNPLITVIDVNSILERDCLLKIVRPFMEDDNIVAVGGTVRIANGCKVKNGYIDEVGLSKSWLARFQVVEYLRAFLFGRYCFDFLNGILIISGAFGCFRRDALIEVGGFKAGSLGEDMEIIVRLQKELREKDPKTRVIFIPDIVCWTKVPEKIKTLSSQRVRWQKGAIESIRLHKALFFNPKYGWLGMLVFPYYTFFEVLGPFIEISGYVVFVISYALGIVPFNFAVAFIAAAFLYGVVLSTLSVCLEELSFKKYKKVKHLIILMVASLLENFGYRQMTAFWRFKGFIEYYTGKRDWGKMEKKGFEQKNEEVPIKKFETYQLNIKDEAS